jgi:hypothetical protein
MLGGNDDSEPAPATTLPHDEITDEIPEPEAEPVADAEPAAADETVVDAATVADAEPVAADEDALVPPANASPQEVLDRLTQYAAEHVPAPEAPKTARTTERTTAPSLEPVGDDLLPRAKRGRRS